MNKLLIITLLTYLVVPFTFAEEKVYQICNKDGHKISYNTMVFKAKEVDVVLFGENHNDPISHWLQL